MNHKIGIYRILGNDLPPRHGENQTELNVGFVLEHEKKYLDSNRVWFLNRIWDTQKLDKLRKMLTDAGEEIVEIPFVVSEYKAIESPQRRLFYATNVNPARNACIDHGHTSPSSVYLLLDGSTYIPEDGYYPWEDLVYTYPPSDEAVYGMPVCRAESFEEILDLNYEAQIRERVIVGNYAYTGMREMYLGITDNCDIRFNETLGYGQVDKVEFMWRLGMRGPWDHYDLKRRKVACHVDNLSKYAGSVKMKGFTVRLPTHGEDGCAINTVRAKARAEGLGLMLHNMDALPD